MHHSLKIKILDLDHIESIVEQDITAVESEKIVGGTLSVSGSQVVDKKIIGVKLSVSETQVVSKIIIGVKTSEVAYEAEPIPIPPHPSLHVVQSINLLHAADLQLENV